MPAPFEIKIDRLRVQADQEVDVFEVELTAANNGGTWVETFSTKPEVEAFLKGAAAASDALGHCLNRPGIPDKPSDYFVRKSSFPKDEEEEPILF